MPNVIPYRAFFYSEKLANKLADLITPPYDVISTEQHLQMVERDPYNSVGLCLPNSSEDANRYTEMKERLQSWKREGIFETISAPAFYLLEETWKVDNVPKKRIGFVGLLEVSTFDKKEVLPHEHTLAGPKKDRLELLKTMRAELSQIFLCYRDPKLILEGIHEKCAQTKPFREVEDLTGVHRKVWLLQNVEDIEAIHELLMGHPVLIADGHHRYETAVAFASQDGKLSSKFAQCYFTNLDTPGFSIEPIHRLFSLPAEMAPATFEARLAESFQISEFKGVLNLENLLKEKAKRADSLCLFCTFRNEKKILLLERKKQGPEDAEIFAIHKDIFEKILDWDVTKLAKGMICYEHETEDYQKTLHQIPYGVGLFLPPTDLHLVMELARQGSRMPQKSTFFFPKLASGLVNYELDSFSE